MISLIQDLLFSSMQKTKLLLQFNALEASRKKLLKELDSLERKTLDFKPAPDKWSITQVLYHLNFSETRSMAYVSKKMQGGSNIKKTGLIADIRLSLLSLLLQSGYKWKAPAILGDVPENLNYEDVIQQWDESRNQLKTFLENLSENLLNREIYRHPRAGRLNAGHMMQFFQDHFDHHLKQVKRLKREAMRSSI